MMAAGWIKRTHSKCLQIVLFLGGILKKKKMFHRRWGLEMTRCEILTHRRTHTFCHGGVQSCVKMHRLVHPPPCLGIAGTAAGQHRAVSVGPEGNPHWGGQTGDRRGTQGGRSVTGTGRPGGDYGHGGLGRGRGWEGARQGERQCPRQDSGPRHP